jgi:hypothetical protein
MKGDGCGGTDMPPDTKLVCTRIWGTGARCNWRGVRDELERVRGVDGEMREACPRCRDADHITQACERKGCWRRHRRVIEGGTKLCQAHYAELENVMHDERRPLEERIEAAGMLLAREQELN